MILLYIIQRNIEDYRGSLTHSMKPKQHRQWKEKGCLCWSFKCPKPFTKISKMMHHLVTTPLNDPEWDPKIIPSLNHCFSKEYLLIKWERDGYPNACAGVQTYTCSVPVDLLLFLFHEHARLESQSHKVTLDFCQRQTRD